MVDFGDRPLGDRHRLAQLGRIELDLDDREIRRVLGASTRLDVRGDPADEIIAATSVVHRVPLVT